MSSVQSMRQFVCDRLTAAAQEILVAFEKRLDDYETELARQRRLLESALTPETKLHRAGLPQTRVSTEDVFNLNKQQHSIQETCPSPVPSDLSQVKQEAEEITVSQQQLQPTRSPEVNVSDLTSNCERSVCSDQSQTVQAEKTLSATTKNPQSTPSNRDISSGSDSGRNLIPLNNECTSTNNKSTSNTISNDENKTLLTSTVQTSHNLSNNGSTTSTSSKVPTPAEKCDGEPPTSTGNKNVRTTPATCGEQTTNKKQDDNITGSDKTLHEGCNYNTTSNGITDPELNKECTNENETLFRGTDLTPQSDGENTTLAKSIEPIPNDRNGHVETITKVKSNEATTSSDGTDTEPQKKHDDQRIASTTDSQTTQNEKSGVHNLTSKGPNETRPLPYGSVELTPNATRNPELTLNKEWNIEAMTAAISTEVTAQQRSDDEDGTSPDSPQPTQNETLSDENTTPVKSSEVTPTKDSSNQTETCDPATNKELENIPTDTMQDKDAKQHKTRKKPSDSKSLKAQPDSNTRTTSSMEKTPALKRSNGNTSNTKNKSPASTNNDGKTTSTTSMKFTRNRRNTVSTRTEEQASHKRPKHEDETLNGSPDTAPQKRRKDVNVTSTTSAELKRSDRRKTVRTDFKKDGNKSDGSAEHNENPYKCERCGKVMSNFKNYKFHMKSHTVAKTYKCNTCSKMFRESWDLNKHLVIHSADKPFKCDICGNGFNRRYNLDLHLRVHTGEKPYKCTTCERSFSSCVNMKKHMRIHTGEKPYTCDDCGKEFADSSSFKNHQRVHTGEKPFKCSYCKKKFATRTTLKRHTRTHTGEKPYKCNVCDKVFGHKTDLKAHIRLHTGEKPYKCDTCGEQFSNWSKLNKHKNVHTSDAESSNS